MRLRFHPVIRVFVSSTFSDLKCERDALQADGFPRLEQICQQEGFQFQAIDLRWGVSGEAGLDHRTMRICFDELRRSQEISPEPNFLILLGNRYGWRPLPEAISEEEFNRLVAVAKAGMVPGIGAKSAQDVLSEWYCQDENFQPVGPSQEPPLIYLLQSRKRDLGDGKNFGRDEQGKDTSDWLAVQHVLWDLINAAFPAEQSAGHFPTDWYNHVKAVAEGRSPLPPIVRFQGSATEQEIWAGALAVPNLGWHVLAFFRDIVNPQDFPDPAAIRDFFDLTESGAIDAKSQAAQADLKLALEKRLGRDAIVPMRQSRLKHQNGQVVIDASEEDIKQLCSEVVERLAKIIRRQIREYWQTADSAGEVASGDAKPAGPSDARKLELERMAHARFGNERTQQFLGRTDELARIAAYLADDADRRPLVVHGPSGTGKTAILAEAAKQVPEHIRPIVRFLGVTPDASDLRGLLVSLCRELSDRYPAATELPTELDKLQEELYSRLATASPQRPIALFLDALDQLSEADGGQRLDWLLSWLPPHVKLVVSCISGIEDDDPLGEPYRVLKRRNLLERAIAVESLTPGEAMALLDRWLEHSQPPRRLTVSQRAAIAKRILPPDAVRCRRPLYLRILFEECRRWPSYRPVTATQMGPDAGTLLNDLLERLEKPEEHGRTVACALGYLASARRGLSENEILEVLWQDDEYKGYLDKLNQDHGHTFSPNATRIPIALWARLRQDLAPYLSEHAAPGASVLNFYHHEVAGVVRERFLGQPVNQRRYQTRLADYFERKPISQRTCDELPWLLREAEAWDRLGACLSDIPRFLALCNSTTKWELTGYWHPLRRMGRDMGQCYSTAYARWAAEPVNARDDFVPNELGIFLLDNGLYPAAEPLLKRALEICERVLGPRHPSTLQSVCSLGGLLFARADYAGAELLFRRALEGCERVLGPNQTETLESANNLASLLSEKGDYAGAELLYRRSLEARERVLGPDHPDTLIAVNNLATLLSSKGHHAAAQRLYRRAIAVEERVLGPDHPNTLASVNNLATSLLKKGDCRGAEALYRRVLEARNRVLGPDHPNTLGSMNNLGGVLLDQSNYADAEPLVRGAMEGLERALGPEHPDTLSIVNTLAGVRENQGDYAGAEPLFRRALEGLLKVSATIGCPHPNLHPTIRNYVRCLRQQGRSDEDIWSTVETAMRPFGGAQAIG